MQTSCSFAAKAARGSTTQDVLIAVSTSSWATVAVFGDTTMSTHNSAVGVGRVKMKDGRWGFGEIHIDVLKNINKV